MYNHARSTMSSGINFSAYRTVCVSPTNINKIVTEFNSYASSKGLTAKYVDPYTYYNLLKASNQGTAANATKDIILDFDTLSGFSTGFDTVIDIEANNKTQGIGTLRADFKNVAGNTSTTQIGGMVRYSFATPVNLSAYKDITIDYWTSYPVEGAAALQINFVTNGVDDGYNFLITLDGAQPGWHTVTMSKLNPHDTANSPDWSNIKALRFTYFNYSGATSPDFIMFDNLQAIKY